MRRAREDTAKPCARVTIFNSLQIFSQCQDLCKPLLAKSAGRAWCFVLQKKNRMDLEELLNAVSEQGLVGEISDEEIFRSVMDMREAEQMMEVNGTR